MHLSVKDSLALCELDPKGWVQGFPIQHIVLGGCGILKFMDIDGQTYLAKVQQQSQSASRSLCRAGHFSDQPTL